MANICLFIYLLCPPLPTAPQGIWNFPGKGLNLCHSYNLRHCCGYTKTLNLLGHGELPFSLLLMAWNFRVTVGQRLGDSQRNKQEKGIHLWFLPRPKTSALTRYIILGKNSLQWLHYQSRDVPSWHHYLEHIKGADLYKTLSISPSTE